MSSCDVALSQIHFCFNSGFIISTIPGRSCMYRVPQSPSPCGKVMLQCGTVQVVGRDVCSGEGNQHAARNGKETTAGCILFSVSGEGGLCSYQETGRGKSSGTAHLQSKPMSMGSKGAWERKLQVEAALGSFVL